MSSRSPRLSIAHVTPYALGARHPVARYAQAAADELAARGHRVVLLGPSRSREGLREAKRAVRAAREDPSTLFHPAGGVRVLEIGEALALSTSPRRSSRSLPVDVSRTIESLMDADAFDVVHVHEPWAPSVSASALRHSRALNVGGFHVPTERLVATQVARRFVELFFGRLDARVASSQATADLVAGHFPGSYRVVLPATDVAGPAERDPGVVRIGFAAEEERAAQRLLLRALRRLDLGGPDWAATIVGPAPATELRAGLRERVTFVDPAHADADAVLAGCDVLVSASAGELTAPVGVLRAFALGAVPVCSHVPVYEELLAQGDRGLLFEPRDVETLAGQLTRLIGDAELRGRLRDAARPLAAELSWSRVADELEDEYARLVERRRDPRGDAKLRAALAKRRLIDVDLHMHTDHSHDCATPVEVLLATAKAQGLGAIAVTDHNEISGAHDAAAKAAKFGVKVIVAEEVKTADQGEVIGLFLEKKIPRGMTLQETIAEIKRQGGLVYVPHPFDRMHAVPDYEHLLAVLDDIDALEVYNARVAIGEFNEEAVRFAAKYRIPGGAGSDAHVAQGLGSVRIRMRDFDGPAEFLESLRSAEIIRQPAPYLYVQALKFLETKATPSGARKARKARRVRRATRRT